MAKKPSSKPALSAEEQKQRLANLTAGIAAVPHVGPASFTPAIPAAGPISPDTAPKPNETPATEVIAAPLATESAPPAPTAITLNEPAADQPAPSNPTPIASSTPAADKEEQKGEKEPGAIRKVTEPVAEQHTNALPSRPDASTQPTADLTTPTAVEDGKFILASLFAASSEKRTFQVRITPDLQQFFQQIGAILGNGASSADIIHNILTQFRMQHGAQIGRALQKELRKMLNSKL